MSERTAWGDEIVALAKAFHDEYEVQAERFGWKSQTPVPWDEVPEANKQTMLCTIEKVRGRFIIDLCPKCKAEPGSYFFLKENPTLDELIHHITKMYPDDPYAMYLTDELKRVTAPETCELEWVTENNQEKVESNGVTYQVTHWEHSDLLDFTGQNFRGQIEATVTREWLKELAEVLSYYTNNVQPTQERRSKCPSCGGVKIANPASKYFEARPNEDEDWDWDGCTQGSGT